jgi:hypothetical protein
MESRDYGIMRFLMLQANHDQKYLRTRLMVISKLTSKLLRSLMVHNPVASVSPCDAEGKEKFKVV